MAAAIIVADLAQIVFYDPLAVYANLDGFVQDMGFCDERPYELAPMVCERGNKKRVRS